MRIKVLKLGESAVEKEVPQGTKVQDVLSELNWTTHGYTTMINGSNAASWTEVKEGDVITLSPKIEGGSLS